jgi:hypothetical protein
MRRIHAKTPSNASLYCKIASKFRLNKWSHAVRKFDDRQLKRVAPTDTKTVKISMIWLSIF